jgi:4-oxalocrotonate tautomerase
MPHVIVKLAPGRSEEQKNRLTDEIVRDVTAIMHCDDDAVSVAIEDIDDDWMEKVYKPEILPNMEKLYKKPGY